MAKKGGVYVSEEPNYIYSSWLEPIDGSQNLYELHWQMAEGTMDNVIKHTVRTVSAPLVPDYKNLTLIDEERDITDEHR